MSYLRLLGPLLACSLITPAVFGRVGENEGELTARYGAVTGRQPARKFAQGQMHIYGELLSYRFEFWTLTAVMIGGRCEEINYVLKGKWTNPHFRRLLEINGGWTEWTEQITRNPDVHRAWLRRDKITADWGLTGFMVRTSIAEKIHAIPD